LTITATVDGQMVHQATDRASASGTYRVEFALPAAIEKGDAQLSIACDDGGVRETIAKTIPINLGKVELKFYPEGGDLVADLSNRVYFAAKNPLGKPVHVEGTIVDDAGSQLASFETKHKGMGSFTFTPAGQKTYRVRVTKPVGVKSESALPAVGEDRTVVLSTGAGVFEAGEPLEATLTCAKEGVPYVCAAYCRGMQVGQEMFVAKAGENKVSLALSPEASGVVRLTVFDYSEQETVGAAAAGDAASGRLAADGTSAKGTSEGAKPADEAKSAENTTAVGAKAADDAKPAVDTAPAADPKLAKAAKLPMPRAIAERLVYRKPDRRLQVRVADHSEQYSPGDKVELSLIATDEGGEPAKSAVLGLAVVDDSLLKLADDDSPGMSTHFYLTSEVEKPEDLEKADFYVSDDEKADEALDLLLGTQGWRRFVERSLEELHQKAKEAGQPAKPEEPIERLLALGGAALPPTVLDNLDEIRPQYERARERVEEEHRAAVGQLGRAAVWGGLILGGLLIAVNVAPLLLRRDWRREWSWLSASRRWGPALVAAALCVLFGVLWAPSMSRAPSSDLVAVQEFKLRPVAVTAETSAPRLAQDASLFLWDVDDKLLLNRYGENFARHHWYFAAPNDWSRVEFAWSEMDLAARVPHYNLALRFEDGYRVDRFFKLAQNRGFNEDYDAPDYRHILLPNQWGTMPWRESAEFGAIIIPASPEADALAKLHTLRFKHNYLYSVDGKAPTVAFIIDPTPQHPLELRAQLDALKQQIEQYRFPVREYAHVHTAGEPGVRSDFAETVFWHPLLVTDENGRASAKFDLSDSVTSYRVLAEAHDGVGRIGVGDDELFARLPFTVEPKLPLEVNAGDRLDIAVGVSNDSARELATVLSCSVIGAKAADSAATAADSPDANTAAAEKATKAAADADASLLKLVEAAEQPLVVPPAGRARRHFTLDVVGQKGTAEIEVRGAAEAHADAKRQAIRVVPPGFPVAESYAGRINGPQEVMIDVPTSIVPGTLEVTLSAYPSTISTLQSGLEGILREPSGCFEQASSSNYPNLLLLQYLEENKVSQPELTRRGKEFLQAGYAKLTGYECKSRGFEWFGADPGHEALTAYGLLEFRDMAKVHDVDRALLDRTANWLLARRDGSGGFQRNTKKLDGFGSAPDAITNAYIVWALTESGQEGIDAEVSRTIEQARASDDAYEVALAAASAVNNNRTSDGRELLGKLTALAQTDGKLVGKQGSITRSGGEALAIETTALAALAWLKLPEFRQQANRAIEWIVRNRSGNGGFGSTQATILALKALVEHAKVNRDSVTAGELVVKHGDRVIGTQAFGADHVNTIKLAGFEGELTAGENKLAISLTGENQMPYTIDVSYRARQPHSHADCAVELTTKLASGEIKAGETVALEAELVNKTKQGQPMTVAILGLPAGLQARADQLEELKKAGTIDYYETRAREVICYWRSLAPQKRVPLKLDLVAEWPGKYTGPASRAYLYYTAEQKHWVEPLAVEIAR
jgi:hypothetical protein